MKNWEFSMTSAMRIAMQQDKYDALNLYLKLEKASKKYLASGDMKEGDSFVVPLEDGAFLRQEFYNKYSTLTLINPNKKEIVAISEEDSYKNEYRYLLGYSQALENSQLGIGPRHNTEFAKALREVKAGQVLVFDNGRSYVCQYNKEDVLRLVRTSNTTKIPYLSEFKNSEAFSINLTDNIGIQKFYAEIRDPYNDDVRCRITTTYKAQELLNKYTAGLDKQTKVLQIGPNKIRMKKSWTSKQISYYDEQGNKVPEEQVKILLGWLNAAPVVTEFQRSQSTPKQEFDDNMARADIDMLFAGKQYAIAANVIDTCCQESKQDLAVNFTSYVENKNGFEAVSFVFKYKDGDTRLYKITYKDNDFSKEPESIQPVGYEEFENFCQKKYNDSLVYIKNQIKDEILPKFPQYHGAFLDRVIENIAKRRLKEEHTITPQIAIAREDVSNLLESYDDAEYTRDGP